MEIIDVDFITKELFKRKIARIPDENISYQSAVKMYADIYKSVLNEVRQRDNHYASTFDDVGKMQTDFRDALNTSLR